MRAGVLALQGDWEAHVIALADVGVEAAPIRSVGQLAGADALVIPGGESTAMLRLMEPEGIDRAIAERVGRGLPVLATCAGVILLARAVAPAQPTLDVLDVDVERNAYGRQVHSAVSTVDVDSELGGAPAMEAVFIRAPRVTRVGAGVRVIGRLGGDAVLVVQNRIVAATFHPELTEDRRVHRLFCRLAEGTDG